MATNKKDGTSPQQGRKAPEKAASRSSAKRGAAAPKRAQSKQ